ncbi:MAG: phospholipid carrier-dependent glycosyltransferase, partial [Bdellovibrionales bacterium]|nr:phospholipid carrier-dependent glycosyltransferase [Bdellovibrionales bacterium]
MSSAERPSIPTILLLALFCYIVALVPRLYDVESRIMQADEEHWIERSADVIRNIEAHKWSVVTSHLSQPGLPPALAMALGQAVADVYNSKRDREWGDPGYIDRLRASRSANAILSSAVAPVVYVGALSVIGQGPALLAALLLALDPHHISISRLAHVDGGLTLLATLALFLYLAAERRRSFRIKMLAAVVWG